MNLKHFFSTAFLAVTIFSFSACNSKSGDLNQGGETLDSQVSFSISIPQGDPITYAPMIHDADEYGIASLWLCEYAYDSNSHQWTLSSNPENIAGDLSGNGPDYSYTRTVKTSDKSSRQFIFVANEAVNDLSVGSTLNDLSTVLAKKSFDNSDSSAKLLNVFNPAGSGDIKRIPMTGQALLNNSPIIAVSGTIENVQVNLTRIVARIDVKNMVPGLVINDLKLSNTHKQSYLFPAMDASQNPSYASPSNELVNNISSFAQFSSLNSSETLAKAFYLYEGTQEEKATAVSVKVSGTLGGIPVFYSIPFWKGDKGVTVKRNHIYYIQLGDGTTVVEPGNNINFSIEDTKWNEYVFNEEFEIIAASYTGTEGSYNKEKQTLNLDKNAHTGNMSFELSSKYPNGNFYASLEGSPAWIQVSVSGNTLHVSNVQENATGSKRFAKIIIYNGSNSNVTYEILIEQEA